MNREAEQTLIYSLRNQIKLNQHSAHFAKTQGCVACHRYSYLPAEPICPYCLYCKSCILGRYASNLVVHQLYCKN